MRIGLQNPDPARNRANDLTSAALVGLIVVLPCVVLEALNNTLSVRNALDVIVLFGLLWLLPAAFTLTLISSMRALREGGGFLAHPFSLLLRVAFLASTALVWGGILIDQVPCLLGVPNCD